MTFDELQLIVQSTVISQREMQATQAEMQATQAQMQVTQAQMQVTQAQMQVTLRENQLLAQSISRGVQAMQEKALTDELKRDEERAEHQAQMAELRLISGGLVNMLSSIDEDRPTILRQLNTIDRKVDILVDRLPPNA